MKTAIAEKTHEATILTMSPSVSLPQPEKGFQYVQVPSDLQKAAITSGAVAALCRIGNGDFIAGLTDDLQEVTKACITLGEKGSVTIKLAFSAGGMKKLVIKPSTAVKAPKEKTEESILFATSDGQLLTRDPDQPELNLRVIDRDTRNIREV
jgi:hypothetical protein